MKHSITSKLMYQNIICNIELGNKVVAVVSAMGRYGRSYATDTLASLVDLDYLTGEESESLFI